MKRLMLALALFSVGAGATVYTKVGSFVQGSTTAIDVGFPVKLLIVWMSDNTATGGAANAVLNIGMCSATGSKTAHQAYTDNTASASTRAQFTQGFTANLNTCLTTFNIADGVRIVVMNVALAGNTFTPSWPTNTDSGTRVVSYWAYGGDAEAKAECANQNVTATGDLAFTTTFTPAAFLMMVSGTTGGTSASTGNIFTFGAQAGTSTNRWAMSFNGATASATQGYSSLTNYAVANPASSSNSYRFQGRVTAVSGSGYTLTIDSWAYAANVISCAVTGGVWTVGKLSQPTTGGAQNGPAVSVGSMTPAGAFFFSHGRADTSTLNTTPIRASFGATDGTAKFSRFYGAQAGSTSNASSYYSTASVLDLMTPNHGTPTSNAVIDSVEFTATNITPHWSAVDATARDVVYIAVGNAYAPVGVRNRRIIN